MQVLVKSNSVTEIAICFINRKIFIAQFTISMDLQKKRKKTKTHGNLVRLYFLTDRLKFIFDFYAFFNSKTRNVLLEPRFSQLHQMS